MKLPYQIMIASVRTVQVFGLLIIPASGSQRGNSLGGICGCPARSSSNFFTALKTVSEEKSCANKPSLSKVRKCCGTHK
jgi:hypothetical protein